MTVKNWLIKAMTTVFSLLELFLFLRLALKFLGAHGGNFLVNGFYQVTWLVVWPFYGIFLDWNLPGGGYVEMATVMTMVGYFIVLHILLVLWGLIPESTSEKK